MLYTRFDNNSDRHDKVAKSFLNDVTYLLKHDVRNESLGDLFAHFEKLKEAEKFESAFLNRTRQRYESKNFTKGMEIYLKDDLKVEQQALTVTTRDKLVRLVNEASDNEKLFYQTFQSLVNSQFLDAEPPELNHNTGRLFQKNVSLSDFNSLLDDSNISVRYAEDFKVKPILTLFKKHEQFKVALENFRAVLRQNNSALGIQGERLEAVISEASKEIYKDLSLIEKKISDGSTMTAQTFQSINSKFDTLKDSLVTCKDVINEPSTQSVQQLLNRTQDMLNGPLAKDLGKGIPTWKKVAYAMLAIVGVALVALGIAGAVHTGGLSLGLAGLGLKLTAAAVVAGGLAASTTAAVKLKQGQDTGVVKAQTNFYKQAVKVGREAAKSEEALAPTKPDTRAALK